MLVQAPESIPVKWKVTTAALFGRGDKNYRGERNPRPQYPTSGRTVRQELRAILTKASNRLKQDDNYP
jgi:hypothetical protein